MIKKFATLLEEKFMARLQAKTGWAGTTSWSNSGLPSMKHSWKCWNDPSRWPAILLAHKNNTTGPAAYAVQTTQGRHHRYFVGRPGQ